MPEPTPMPTPTPMPHPHPRPQPFPYQRIITPVVYTTTNCQPTLCQAQVIANKNQLINDLANGNANSSSENVKLRAQNIQAAQNACNNFTSGNIITY